MGCNQAAHAPFQGESPSSIVLPQGLSLVLSVCAIFFPDLRARLVTTSGPPKCSCFPLAAADDFGGGSPRRYCSLTWRHSPPACLAWPFRKHFRFNVLRAIDGSYYNTVVTHICPNYPTASSHDNSD
jgi:hypothetical protein